MSSEIQEFGEKDRKKHNMHIKYEKHKKGVNKQHIIVGVVSLIILVVFIVIIASNCSKKDENNDRKESSKQDESSSALEETSGTIEPALNVESSDSQIYTLVTSYIDAAYVKCDATLVGELMDSTENIDVKKNEIRQRYIEAYNDIAVYVLDGTEDTNVVFVSYNAKLYNYEDMLPSGEMLMIKKNASGNYLIHNIEVGEQFEKLMTNEKQVEELSELKEKIQSEYNAVIESNSEIKSIVDILNGAKNQ